MIQELIGLFILLAGVAVYVLGILSVSDKGEVQNPNDTVGICLALFSTLIRGFHAAYQGRFMLKYKFPPVKTACFDSLVATVYCGIFIGIFNGIGNVDSTDEFWAVVRSSEVFLTVEMFGFICIGFNGGASVISKYVSGLYRIVLYRIPSSITWFIELACGWTEFSWLVLGGYFLIFIGIFIFVGLVPRFMRPDWLKRPMLSGCCDYLRPSKQAILSPNQEIKYGHLPKLPF